MKMSIRAAVVAAALLAAGSAKAQVVPQFDLERLTLDPSAVSSLVVGTGEVRPVGDARLSLAAHYENSPLVLRTDGTVVGRGLPFDGTRAGDIVKDRITAHLGAAVTVVDGFELNARLPIVVKQSGTANLPGVANVAGSGFASPAFGFRLRVLDQATGPVNVAIAAEAIAPVGSRDALAGNTQWTFTPRLEAGRNFGAFVLGAEAGMFVRESEISFAGRRQGSEFRGGVVAATTGALRGELSVRGGYSQYKDGRSVEALAGLRYAFSEFEAFALGGPGFFEEPGTPKYRGIVGLAYLPKAKPAAPPPAPPPPPTPKVVDPCAPGNAHTPAQCPGLDDDGDGIKNADDACPSVAGIPEEKGCPAKDTDGDGIPDHKDKCPTVAGIAELEGCPAVDTDADGIPDHKDKCPTVPGVADNDGCPPAKAKLNTVTKKIDILEKVYFDTSKATIQDRSYPLLDEVAGVLTSHPELTKVLVEGHTDNTGAADFNTWLSDERAKAVKAYLVKKGIDAARLDAKGFGPSKPVADNKTKEGREQNRRVEFTIP